MSEHCEDCSPEFGCWTDASRCRKRPTPSSLAAPSGSVEVFHICEHCNTEYQVPMVVLHNMGRKEWIHNFDQCPHCDKRNDLWVRIGITPNNAVRVK